MILGSRQVGKTTLARGIAEERPAVYLDLESDRDRVKLTEPGPYFRQHSDKLVILDNIHRAPEIFQELRAVIDDSRRAGRRVGQFLILGSPSTELLRQSGETLAGRLAYSEIHPLNLLEVGAAGIERLWVRGGYPDSYLADTDRASDRWRQDFIRTYLERDIPMFGPRVPVERLRRFWTMLAQLDGGLLNAAALARNLDVDSKTVKTYLDLLVDLLLVRRLQPWQSNAGKRLVKAPKIYIRDTGVLHSLLQIPNLETLLGHPKQGDSWEGFVIENIASVLPEGTPMHFYRSAAGAEIDLLVQMNGETWAIDITRSTSPRLSRGFHIACDDLAVSRRIVVHGGAAHLRLGQGVDAFPLSDFLGLFGADLQNE
ncbi:ATP-binding protein [Pseudoruegeria sp. SK021]|uniref:ATP-binding protein n=1 Tax=Pseudoruegeria sp. SK021 TaxID=1933035 RepID=UPI001F0A2EA1|nr:ATP-binding protein [Pseudoruegeria sp. SK021]